LQQQPIVLVVVLVCIELLQRPAQIGGGDQIAWLNTSIPAAKAPAISSRLPRLRMAKLFCSPRAITASGN